MRYTTIEADDAPDPSRPHDPAMAAEMQEAIVGLEPGNTLRIDPDPGEDTATIAECAVWVAGRLGLQVSVVERDGAVFLTLK
jgi:hypothetical protein